MILISLLLVTLFDLISTDQGTVTCGSTFKLVNLYSGFRLHSHEVKYGSGSGQQSVTGTSNADDVNSYWQIRGDLDGDCERGVPIQCDSVVRLLHLATRKYLHSHYFASPLSHNQEVSAYGDNGVGDDGDRWKVICTTNHQFWIRQDPIRLQHVVTGKYLHVTGDTFGRPIHGQKEISAFDYANSQNLWKVDAGIYIQRSSEPLAPNHHEPLRFQSIYQETNHFNDEL